VEIKKKLIKMAGDDQKLREDLVREGVLYDGYHPDMESLHVYHSQELRNIIDQIGWPKKSDIGEDGSYAAWIILIHAISTPQLLRDCLPLIKESVEIGEADSRWPAVLEDTICFHERRPQVYGTVFDWDEEGQMSPWDIDEPDTVDERRYSVKLPPLEKQTQNCRAFSKKEGAKAPNDLEQRQKDTQAWREKVGWLMPEEEQNEDPIEE